MGGGVVVVALDDVVLTPFEIPGGAPAVRTALLRESGNARTVLVQFPEGWSRPSAGSYAASEVFVVVDGTLEMNWQAYGAGDGVHVPAGARRADTRARSEVLAVAHFDGPARWSPAWDAAAVVRRLGSDGGRLVAGATSDRDLELVSVASRIWAWVPAGARVPDVGDAVCFTT